MMAPVGDRWKVMGISSTMPVLWPIPGSTPTSMPTMQPTMAKGMFSIARATPSP